MHEAEHGTFTTWPTGGGEMGVLIRALDWTQTPLGPIEGWPQSLRSALAICLGSRSAIGIYWGADLTLLYNDAWRELIGDKHPSALGRPAREVFPEIWETIGPMFAHVLSTGEATASEGHHLPLYRHGFREECYFDYTANPLPSEDGSVGGIFNIAVEVTERVLAQKSLRESEERLNAALHAGRMATWDWNPATDQVTGSDTMNDLFGLRPSETLQSSTQGFGLVHPDDVDRHRALVERAIERGESWHSEFRIIRPRDGAVAWLEERATAKRDPQAGRVYMTGIIWDITERKLAEEALRKSEERLQLAIDAAQLGRWELVPKTGEFFTSAISNRHLGLSPDAQPTHEGHFETIHPDDHEMIYRRLRRALEESGEFEVEYRTLHPGGAVRWIMSRARVVHDGGGARFIGVTLDVTEHRQADEERARLRALELSARAEAKERERISRELHDRVAHSMAVAHQSLQLYERYSGSDPSRAAEKLDLAKEATQTALEQTRDLSAELMRVQETDTAEGLVPALRTLLDNSLPEGVRADLSSSGEESQLPKPLVAQMYLIMREAVRNAVEHSGCGRVGVGLEVRRDEVLGYVQDDGSGFDPDEVGDGGSPTGVGLRSMRDRTELLGGELRIASKRGGGTRLEILVPLGESEG